MKTFFKALTFIIIWGVLLGGGYVFYEVHSFLKTPASTTPQEVVFGIKSGSTFDRVAWDLKKAGIITDVFRFRLLAQYHDALGKVKAGEFLLSTGWTPDKVLYQITHGQAMLYRLSIREGLTWWETARAVEEQGFAAYDDFRQVIHDPAFLRAHNIPFENAEGFLYPETYLLKKPRSPLDREQARAVADVMVRAFWKKNAAVWKELPLRPDLRDGAASMPGSPLLPARQGAMSSSAQMQDKPTSAAGTASAASGPQAMPPKTGGTVGGDSASPSSVNPRVLGHSTTLENGAAPVNVETALPGAASVVRPAVPQPMGVGQEGWHATITPSGMAPSMPQILPDAAEQAGGGQPRAEAQTSPPPAVMPGMPEPGQGSGKALTGIGASAPDLPAAQTPEASPPAQDPTAPPAASGTGPVSGAASEADASLSAPLPAGAADPATQSPRPAGPQSPAEVDSKALRRLITLASLVEKETGLPSERAKVAGVYANRLRINMLLQCDPTIIYGVGPAFSGAIRRSQIDDPKNLYNTYQHPGLPPGPICSPGQASIQAAHTPEVHDYLYFVATGIDAGHTFSKTLGEHNKAVQIYRERMRGNGGKGK